MKKQTHTIAQRLAIWLGIALVVAAGILMLLWRWNIRTSQETAASYVHTLRTLLPESQSALPEPRLDNTMAAFSLDGNDFVGILEMPEHGSSLPVCAQWGNVSRYPCRFDGSIYDGTMQIGLTSQKGQYDFYREISVGDSLFFTDVTGNRYTYTVTDLRYESHADQTALRGQDADLTLFIKNVYGFDYILVFCDTP